MGAGVQDAYASAGTFAITNYMDLGSGVLILWSVAVRLITCSTSPRCSLLSAPCAPRRYGGIQTMDQNGLSVGDLITFQLYWNMLSS
jgi:hypothetical protein